MLSESLRRCICRHLTFYPTLCRSFNKSIYTLFWLLDTHMNYVALRTAYLSLFVFFFLLVEKQQITHSMKYESHFVALINATIFQAQIFYTSISCRRKICSWLFVAYYLRSNIEKSKPHCKNIQLISILLDIIYANFYH